MAGRAQIRIIVQSGDKCQSIDIEGEVKAGFSYCLAC
jgi:hypothetical protein